MIIDRPDLYWLLLCALWRLIYCLHGAAPLDGVIHKNPPPASPDWLGSVFASIKWTNPITAHPFFKGFSKEYPNRNCALGREIRRPKCHILLWLIDSWNVCNGSGLILKFWWNICFDYTYPFDGCHQISICSHQRRVKLIRCDIGVIHMAFGLFQNTIQRWLLKLFDEESNGIVPPVSPIFQHLLQRCRLRFFIILWTLLWVR